MQISNLMELLRELLVEYALFHMSSPIGSSCLFLRQTVFTPAYLQSSKSKRKGIRSTLARLDLRAVGCKWITGLFTFDCVCALSSDHALSPQRGISGQIPCWEKKKRSILCKKDLFINIDSESIQRFCILMTDFLS